MEVGYGGREGSGEGTGEGGGIMRLDSHGLMVTIKCPSLFDCSLSEFLQTSTINC